MTQEELKSIITTAESYRLELTVSTGNMDKFQEAICAFANDMPGKREKGYLLIGVKDDGTISGLRVDDALMKKISGIRSDGNILPLPVMNTEKVTTDEGDVLVVEVTPSFDTPVRYRGRTFIRIGPRRDIASAEEERILSERCAASLPTFDTRPCRDAKIEDIDTETIIREYMPKAIDPAVLAGDHRPLKEQLAALHMFNTQWDCPTYAALIMFGHNPRYFMPGAYIQFVRFHGNTNGGKILNERRFEGCLYKMLPELENFVRDGIITNRPVPVSILREKNVVNYPYKAIRELLMNACMHRDYQANMPTRLYQYDNHIEIMNPGGLYGQARPENFPNVNDYRNSVVAEMMKNLNYVNMFNHGIGEVQELLKENESPKAEFNVGYLTAFSVVLQEPNDVGMARNTNPDDELDKSESETTKLGDIKNMVQILSQACPKLSQAYLIKAIMAIKAIKDKTVPLSCILKINNEKNKTRLRKNVLIPMLDDNLIAMTHPDTPRHPQQKYYLTDLGLAVLKQLEQENKQ